MRLCCQLRVQYVKQPPLYTLEHSGSPKAKNGARFACGYCMLHPAADKGAWVVSVLCSQATARMAEDSSSSSDTSSSQDQSPDDGSKSPALQVPGAEPANGMELDDFEKTRRARMQQNRAHLLHLQVSLSTHVTPSSSHTAISAPPLSGVRTHTVPSKPQPSPQQPGEPAAPSQTCMMLHVAADALFSSQGSQGVQITLAGA